MEIKSQGWRWIEIEAQSLSGQTFESLTTKYRGEKPIALITPLRNLDGYSVLNTFSPIHSVFWCANKNYRNFDRKCYESVEHLADDINARKSFMKDLRQAKISKTDPQIRLFDRCAQILNVAPKAISGLGSTTLNYPENGRFVSYSFPSRHLEQVIEYLEQETAELGQFAFFRIDESIRLCDLRGRSSLGSLLFGFNFSDIAHITSSAELQKLKQEILRELKFVITRLEDGIDFDTPIEPITIIKGIVSFPLIGIGPYASEFEDDIAREILSYRSRLIRLLEWPAHYSSVIYSLDTFRQQKKDMNISVFHPYDVESELEAYLHEMEQRYPILTRVLFE